MPIHVTYPEDGSAIPVSGVLTRVNTTYNWSATDLSTDVYLPSQSGATLSDYTIAGAQIFLDNVAAVGVIRTQITNNLALSSWVDVPLADGSQYIDVAVGEDVSAYIDDINTGAVYIRWMFDRTAGGAEDAFYVSLNLK
jgi:hypothetical protein